MTPQEIRQLMDRMDSGRRAASRLITLSDLGLDPVKIIHEVAPGLSPVAVDAARRLAGLCGFDFACLALVLSGLASDAIIGGAEIPEPPARPDRKTPDELAADLLGLELPPALEPPSATVVPEDQS
jgi:hypothetical protein